MEFGPIIYTIIMILGISFIYLASNWRKDFFDKEAAVIVVAIIISVIVIPQAGVMRDYNTEYCNNKWHDITGKNILQSHDYSILIEEKGFFSCEIGFLNGYARLELDVIFSNPSLEVDIMILDHYNYNQFLRGGNYGISNTDLFTIQELSPDITFGRASDTVETEFLSDTYFLVVNWNYRNSYGSEEIERPYFIEQKTYEECKGEVSDSEADWNLEGCAVFYNYIDLEYIDEDSGNITRAIRALDDN